MILVAVFFIGMFLCFAPIVISLVPAIMLWLLISAFFGGLKKYNINVA